MSCPSSWRGLGQHLTDIRPVEIVTLVPLGTLVVVFGLFPGLILTLVQGTVDTVLTAVTDGTPVALYPFVR